MCENFLFFIIASFVHKTIKMRGPKYSHRHNVIVSRNLLKIHPLNFFATPNIQKNYRDKTHWFTHMRRIEQKWIEKRLLHEHSAIVSNRTVDQ